MNNPVLETNINNQNNKAIIVKVLLSFILITSLIIIGWWLVSKNDPYVDEVLSFQGNIERGQAIFTVNCASCHGSTGGGNVGPSLHNIAKHKSETSIIEQVVSGKTPPMPKFQASAEDMADLLVYLRQLSAEN